MRLILALLAALLSTATARAGDLDAAFYVMRKGEPIGYHIVNVHETAEGLVVDTRIAMTVKFGPLPLYRYRHIAREIWRGGVLQTLTSRTNDNGQKMSLQIERDHGVLMIDGDAYRGPAPQGAMPSSYWNRSVVKTPVVINTQNGELIDVDVKDLGETAAPFAGEGEHYRVTGALTVDVYYDGQKWIGSDFNVRGEQLTYKPVAEPADRTRLLAKLD